MARKGLEHYAAALGAAGVRHHLDAAENMIRVVFVTQRYRNPRGERLAIVQVSLPEGGIRCRAAIERAFVPAEDAAATCLVLCGVAADNPIVGVHADVGSGDLGIVAEMPVEDGATTTGQLLALIDAVVAAAEAGQAAVEHGHARLQRTRKGVA